MGWHEMRVVERMGRRHLQVLLALGLALEHLRHALLLVLLHLREPLAQLEQVHGAVDLRGAGQGRVRRGEARQVGGGQAVGRE